MFRKFSEWAKISIRNVPKSVRFAAVVIVLISVPALVFLFRPSPCGADSEFVDGECIGMMDGQVGGFADLADVLGKIREENEWVDREDPESVSVAYLVPLPKPSLDEGLARVLRHELQGAYVAQWQANHKKLQGDKPMVRLLVINYGPDSKEWRRVVPILQDKLESERLVTAVVTGRTLDATIEAIDGLRKEGIPVIASRLTGNSLTKLGEEALEGLGGLARVAPTNLDQAKVAAVYLRQEKPNASRALLVQDVDPQDSYLRSLGEAYTGAFAEAGYKILDPPETYNSQLGAVANTMKVMLGNICQQRPDVILFAGRSSALVDFVREIKGLRDRTCADVKVTILAGADTVEFADAVKSEPELAAELKEKTLVRYTTQAHPGSWSRSPDSFHLGASEHFDSCEGCYDQTFALVGSLDDGAAIIGYDAVLTALVAIRAGQGTAINDKPALVTQWFRRMHGVNAVKGSSGYISLREGATVNKAVVILGVQEDGAVEWLRLSSNSLNGKPCVPTITDC